MLVTEQPDNLPSGNDLDNINLGDTPPAYLSFGATAAALEDPPAIGEQRVYVVLVKCVGQSQSERQDGEMRYSRKLHIVGCREWENGKQAPTIADEQQPGLFDDSEADDTADSE